MRLRLTNITSRDCGLSLCFGLGMPSTLLDQATQRLPRRFRQRSNDVFALVKAFVSDNHLSQPALLVLPGDTIDEHVEPAMLKLALGEVSRNSSKWNQTRHAFYAALIPSACCLCISSFSQGSAHFLEDKRKDDLLELAATLRREYPQYERGCRYLESLAGQVARHLHPLPEISFILAGGNPGLQRGSPTLEDPEPYAVHRLNVTFHRYN